MDNSDLFMRLKSEDVSYVKELLKSVDNSLWPIEVLIPFVLIEALRSPLGYEDLSYVEKCFRMFSNLRRLQDLQKREAAELHRMSLLTKSLCIMLKYKKCENVEQLGDYVMRSFQLIVRRYGGRRYARQFKYLTTVCHRRSRLLDFQKKFRPLYPCFLERLRKHGLRFVGSLIAVMVT